jgi:hypothetical protein
VTDPECTFRPQLNENTNKIYKKLTGGRVLSFEQRMAEMSRKTAEYERRREQLRKEREEEEVRECSFHPKIDSRVPRAYDSADGTAAGENGAVADDDGTTVAERSQRWEAARRERLEAARAELEAERLAECTFAPKVSRPAPKFDDGAGGGAGNDHQQSGDGGPSELLSSQRGFDAFIERQRAAREAREAKEHFFDPKDPSPVWARRITKPKEFALNRPHRVASVKKVQPRRLRSYRDGLAALSSADGESIAGANTTISENHMSLAAMGRMSTAGTTNADSSVASSPRQHQHQHQHQDQQQQQSHQPSSIVRPSRHSVARASPRVSFTARGASSPQTPASSSLLSAAPAAAAAAASPADAERQRRIDRFARMKEVLKQRHAESPESQMGRSARGLREEEDRERAERERAAGAAAAAAASASPQSETF